MKVSKGKEAARKKRKEVLQPVEDRKVGKRKAALKANERTKKQAKNEHLDRPKRPPSAFFVFLEEFRQIYKQEHPNVKAVSAVGKAGGEKWRSMSHEEKAPYEAKAAKRKSDYEQLMSSYNKKQQIAEDDEEEESEKSKSEFNDEDDWETAEEDEDDEED